MAVQLQLRLGCTIAYSILLAHNVVLVASEARCGAAGRGCFSLHLYVKASQSRTKLANSTIYIIQYK